MNAPLRIAIFVHEFPALSETFVLNQITGLIDQGCEVTIFANAVRSDSLQHDEVQEYDLTPRTCYLAMPGNRLKRLLVALSLVGRYRRRIPRWLLRSLNVLRYGREASSLKLLFWTVRLFEAGNSFDVVYCHFGLIGRTASFLREIGVLRGSLVTAFHGVDVSASLRTVPALYDQLFANGDRFLPVSRHWAARLQAHGCDPDRLAVHHMGVDLDKFRYRQRTVASDGALRLLTVGRMVEKKGIEYGLRAAATARERGVNLRYTIIGDGLLRRPLEALAEELGLRDVVTFFGWRLQAEIVVQMYRSHILVAPSVTDRDGDQEGIPVTLMEAMATGLPVISTRHSGIPELVRDGESGFLVDEADVDGLATAIVRLNEDCTLRTEMGRRGRAVVVAGFDTKTLNATLLRHFEELSGRAPAASMSVTKEEDGELKRARSA